MKTHADPRCYNCSHPDSLGQTACSGRMQLSGHEPRGKKQAVYKCSTCGRVLGESMLLYGYNKMRLGD